MTALFRENKNHKNFVWDVLAAAYVLDPSIVTDEVYMPIDVNDTYSISYGQTVAFPGTPPPGTKKAHIVQKIDRKKFWKLLTKTFDQM